MNSDPKFAEWSSERPQCIVIGYNEEPFPQYERLIRNFGKNSVAYRDLQLSFLRINKSPMTYVDLFNYSIHQSRNHYVKERIGRIKSGDIPNLAAIYLTNFLLRRGVRTRYINLFQDEKDLLADYLYDDPLCVAITTTFYILNQPLYEMIKFIRSHNSRVKIVVGGPLIANHHRNLDPEAFRVALEDIGADIYVIDSQGELTLVNLVKQIGERGDLNAVPNIVYFQNGRLVRTDVIPENNSMDENYIDWSAVADARLGPTVQTRTARSCAFSCSFCNYPARAGRLTLSDVATIEKELNLLKECGDVKNLIFIDDTFNVPLKRFKDICRMMIKNNYNFKWFSYFRCSNADEEAIGLMAESGCKGVFLGIESGSPMILKNMNKIAKIEDYRKGIRLLKSNDIMTFASFIVGFPGETGDSVSETQAFIAETMPTYYRAQVWYCEPGTPIMAQRDKYKIDGEGFSWRHATMESAEAIEHVENTLRSIDGSVWLPQWSFDFWIIPYLLGKGITFGELEQFLRTVHKLLKLQVASPYEDGTAEHSQLLKDLVQGMNGWLGAGHGVSARA